MQPITPSIRLHTYQETQDIGLQISALILEYRGNNYHLHGGSRDTIHVFTESLGIYVLTINKGIGYMGLNAYMTPEPDPINSLCLHYNREISEYLGAMWEQLKPESIVRRLIDYLY